MAKETSAATPRCLARYHGKRCERRRLHRGFHRVDVSPSKTVEWADLFRVWFWKERAHG